MSSTLEPRSRAPSLSSIALAAVAATYAQTDDQANAEPALENAIRDLAAIKPENFAEALDHAMANPSENDQRLIFLGGELELKVVELLAIAVAVEVEFDAMAGRIISHIQSPLGNSRPTLGLVKHAFDLAFKSHTTLPSISNGAARKSGLLKFENTERPLPEQSFTVPTPLCMALRGYDCEWPQTKSSLPQNLSVPLPQSIQDQALKHAKALDSRPGLALIIRSGSNNEAFSVAREISLHSGRDALLIEGDALDGIGPWLLLRACLPVFARYSGPGDRQLIPELTGYNGPIIAIASPDCEIDFKGRAPTSWQLDVPAPQERNALWRATLPESENLDTLANDYRHGAGRIAHLSSLAQHSAAIDGRAHPSPKDIQAAAWSCEGEGLDALALSLKAQITDEALITSPELKADLDSLLNRCRLRDSLDENLGASAQANYRSGVRALFTGPSGTGKTLGVGWVATRLKLPLFRVDLASVTSKYIGETEKNLSKLLALAEQADVILLFDEADALFGKRTDVNDANDRYANAQTNYLLQRIENYDGIIVLTSNSQSRFDSAFARRLDFIIDFPTPSPQERRRIWQSHLGKAADITPVQLNDLSALIEVSGGHIRNIVLAAAARAKAQNRKIAFQDLINGLASEFRKLGRQVPLRLKRNLPEETSNG